MVADRRQQAAVRLVLRGKGPRQRLIDPHMPPPQPCVFPQRIIPLHGQSQGVSIQQGHIRPLPQLRAGPMCRIADKRHSLGIGPPQMPVAIPRRRHLIRRRDPLQKRPHRRPMLPHLRLPSLQITPRPFPQLCPVQRPEHRRPWPSIIRQTPRWHDPRHPARPEIPLLQFVPWQRAALGPHHMPPHRPIAQPPRLQRRQL
jgi:hypothetical protein